MSKLSRMAIIPAAAALLSVGGFARNAVGADAPGWSVVEASQDFCVDVSVPCNDSAHLYNLGYEEVAAVNRSGNPYATPNTVVFVCAKTYKGSDGKVHGRAGHVFAGYDPGVIRGHMRVFNNATETNTHAKGAVQLYARDDKLGTTGTAAGTQETNNVTDVPLSGSIDITISGNLEDSVGIFGKPTIVQGTISCTIRLPYAIGPKGPGQPPDSESVVSDLDGD